MHRGGLPTGSRMLSPALQNPAGFSAAHLIHLYLISLWCSVVSMLIGMSGKLRFATFKNIYLTLKRHSQFELVQSWPIVQPLLSLMALNFRGAAKNIQELSLHVKMRKKQDQLLY